jgi:hypothetical protein
MIYTSNFALHRMRRFPGAISIARTAPLWYAGPTCLILAPSADLLVAWKAGRIDKPEYVRRYWAEHRWMGREYCRRGALDRCILASLLTALVSPHDPVLLCWERAGAFCHRRLVADWLRAAGIECEEIAS